MSADTANTRTNTPPTTVPAIPASVHRRPRDREHLGSAVVEVRGEAMTDEIELGLSSSGHRYVIRRMNGGTFALLDNPDHSDRGGPVLSVLSNDDMAAVVRWAEVADSCLACFGTGQAPRSMLGVNSVARPCPECRGTGRAALSALNTEPSVPDGEGTG